MLNQLQDLGMPLNSKANEQPLHPLKKKPQTSKAKFEFCWDSRGQFWWNNTNKNTSSSEDSKKK